MASLTLIPETGQLQEDIQHLVSAHNYYWRHGLPCFPERASEHDKQKLRNLKEIEQTLHAKLGEVKYFLVEGRYYIKYIGQRPLEHPQAHPSCHILEIVAPSGLCTRLASPFLTFMALTDKWIDVLSKAPAVTAAQYSRALNKTLTKGRFDEYGWTLLPSHLW